jgi:nucleotide-binding universal stress UspA family protein
MLKSGHRIRSLNMSPHEIVVGLDDSSSARAALRWAADQARRTGVVLRAVHALSWPFGVRRPGFDSDMERQLSFDEIDARYRASITAVFDEINPRPDWLIQFARGDAGPVLVRQSRNASLLVIGTPEHVGLGRLIVGSVGHYCLSHAACPLVAVPAASEPPLEVAAQAMAQPITQ